MTSRLKLEIAKKIQQFSGKNNIYNELQIPVQKRLNRPVLQWPLPEGTSLQKTRDILGAAQSLILDSEYVVGVELKDAAAPGIACVEFELDRCAFATQVLNPEAVAQPKIKRDEHVVVEFSSPNIAKPFHFGHLRSTIIGNVLANLHLHAGYRTSKINFLGDWGTQFGLLALGVQMSNISDEEMRSDPIRTLYNAYVKANNAAEIDSKVWERARNLFTELECESNSNAEASSKLRNQWRSYRQYTTDELKNVYARLGVYFDHYEWESKYSQKQIGDVLERLRSAGLLSTDEKGRQVVEIGAQRVPIIKSDGSTLYLARDIAALLDRMDRFNFSRIIYVVDHSQSNHFNALFHVGRNLSKDLANKQMTHVRFGKIIGMSTRRGDAVFLEDVLNEARDRMREKREIASTTRKNNSYDDDEVCDILGVSAVIINDLKQRRLRNYEFCWTKALQANGDTGIKLQYTHCRLHSLLQNFAHIDLEVVTPNWELCLEAHASELIYEIARFDQVVWHAKEQLEASILVNYLFSFCNAISRALKVLQVKNEPNEMKQANRLLLFNAAKRTLRQGMEILGLRPLNQM